MKEYAVYKGEALVCIGTALQCAQELGIKLKSFHFYKTPAYQRRIERRKKARNYITVVPLDD